MRTAVITVAAGLGLFSSIAAAERLPGISSVARDGYYRSENGYQPAVPPETSRPPAARAFVPEIHRPAMPAGDGLAMSRQHDERRPAPALGRDGRR